MAGNRLNTKTKGKEEKSKSVGKSIEQNNEDSEVPDFALLRKPVFTSVTGFGQARKIYDWATEELKTLLSNECDVLYECKVCRNLFRSLANFISHKRVYCKEKFNISVHGHFIKPDTMISELLKIKRFEENYQESLKENVLEIMKTDEDDERVPFSKDLTEIIEKIANKKLCNNNNDEQMVITENIPSNSAAVYQSIEPIKGRLENMKLQVEELHNMLSRDTAVLQKDGKFKMHSTIQQESDNVIQISDDDDDDCSGAELKCKICDMQFSTTKTLKHHLKHQHKEDRLVYSCPECLDIFSTTWSVYRHLFKVHRKTAAQIRRLRESIQAKAFKMNNPPAFYERRKNNIKTTAALKISEEEKLDQENQAWMDNMEGDAEGPRCGGCGRSFERRAALAAHTHTCVPRTRALSAARLPRRQDNKRIQIQIRRDYNKEPVIASQPAPAISSVPARTIPKNEIKINDEETVAAPSSPQNDEDDVSTSVPDDVINPVEHVSEEELVSGGVSGLPEKMDCTNLGEAPEPVIKLPFARQAEKGNLAALKVKIKPDIDLDKLMCKKCETLCNTINELYDHTAEHYKWMRYACKLCNYKHYHFEKLSEHVKVVHKLKGDKDFHFSTVKAIDGPEALELSENLEIVDPDDIGPDSRRPSRCSSDSSRLSDDSSSSSIRIESRNRKRKAHPSKIYSKKRKETSTQHGAERREDSIVSDKDNDNDSSSNIIKPFEENSSDIDDQDDKIIKRLIIDPRSVASRRPVRKKIKPKKADFEYDLSNLLKMEAQGYRDSQPTTTTKSYQAKKKNIQQDILMNYAGLNKYFCGALVSFSKKAVEKSAAHMKVTSFPNYYSHKDSFQNVFVRPMVPKNVKGDKLSPKKDILDKSESTSFNIEMKDENKCSSTDPKEEQKDKDKNDSTSFNKELNIEDKHGSASPNKEEKNIDKNDHASSNKAMIVKDKHCSTELNRELQVEENDSNTPSEKQKVEDKNGSCSPDKEKIEDNKDTQKVNKDHECEEEKVVCITNTHQKNDNRIFTPSVSKDLKTNKIIEEVSIKTQNKDIDAPKKDRTGCFNKQVIESSKNLCEILKPVPAVVPLKIRPQSLEVVKTPMINKNIKDFTKTGLKTKIVVIKPINRNQDVIKSSLSSPLKFQTIKLKDPNKTTSREDKSSDQVVVVKVPKVECVIPRTTAEATITSREIVSNTSIRIDNPPKTTMDENGEKASESSNSNHDCGSLVRNSISSAEDSNTVGVNNESAKDLCDTVEHVVQM